MNALQKFYIELDKSDSDFTNESSINDKLKKIITKLDKAGDNENAHLANIDREVFAFNKSFDKDPETKEIKGISCKMAGTQTLEDGTTKPIYWPDIEKFTENDFRYIGKRYHNTKNSYAKTEYGILLYFKSPFKKHKHNQFKKELCNEIFDLSKNYLIKAKIGGEKNYYVMDYIRLLKGVLYISNSSKFKDTVQETVNYCYSEFLNWDPKIFGTLRFILDSMNIVINNYKIFDSTIDIEKINQKCIVAANKIEKDYVWGSIYIADIMLKFQLKISTKFKFDWLKYKAGQYEKLALDAKKSGNINVIISFIDKALSIYQKLGDSKNIIRLEKEYANQRGNKNLSKKKFTLPKKETDRIQRLINKTINENDSQGIIDQLILSPMLESLDNIHLAVKEGYVVSVFQSLLPISIIDKLGNKIGQYLPGEPEDGYDSNFWQTYDFYFQLGSQTLVDFFFKAFKSGKLSFDTVKEKISSSWLSQPIYPKFNDKEYIIVPADIINPTIRLLFEELEKWKIDNDYKPNSIPIIDSLTLKIEALLRYMCEKINIPTFKRVRDTDIVMERNLDDILASLKNITDGDQIQQTNFREDDRVLIKYYLTEKAGINLRNEIAHGLLAPNEYSIFQSVILLTIILKLSNYKFTSD